MVNNVVYDIFLFHTEGLFGVVSPPHLLLFRSPPNHRVVGVTSVLNPQTMPQSLPHYPSFVNFVIVFIVNVVLDQNASKKVGSTCYPPLLMCLLHQKLLLYVHHEKSLLAWPTKKYDNLLVDTDIFCLSRGLILCSAERLQFHRNKKTRTSVHSSTSLLFNYVVLFLIDGVVASVCVTQNFSSLRQLH